MVEKCCIIITTTNDQQVVNQIAASLLENNLAACVQVDNIVSHFKWKGVISQESEYRIMIKAKSNNYNNIEKTIIKLHNYELPQIIKLDIQGGLPQYLSWVAQDT
ncbi:MAG: divalent-cation tolerance protein CutA [Candidatus Rickettsia vulgarisii]